MLNRCLSSTCIRAFALAVAVSSLSCTDGTGPKGPDNSIASIDVAAPIASLLVSETFQASAVVRNSGGGSAVAGAITWRSSNTSVASVSANGTVTAVGVGTTQISAESGGSKGEMTVRVVATEIIQSVDQYSGGTLAFTSTRGGALDVFVVGPAGVQRVTTNPDHEQFDGWSPDGNRLAFIRFPPETGDFTSHIVNTDGSNDVVVERGLVQWSPNWTKRNSYREGRLVVTNPDGSNAVIVTPPAGDTVYGGWWAPDGSKLAFVYAPTRAVLSDIYVVNADGSGLRNLTNSPNVAEEYANWSPDGTRLAMSGHNYFNGIGSSLYVANVNGSEISRITSNTTDQDDFEPEWSPNGNLITFTAVRLGTFGMYVISASGGTPVRLSPANMVAGFGKWSADGTRLAFTAIIQGTSRQNIFVMTLDRTKIFQISARSLDNLRPVWKP